MSRAIASARQRRAGIEPQLVSPPQQSNKTPDSSTSGLTLQQVIALVDTRLIRLEGFMKESQESHRFARSSDISSVELRDSSDNVIESSDDLTDLNQILEEYNNRFVLLADEISQMKEMLLKLQTYTMDVNKMLLDERVNVLSDIGNDNSVFLMNNTLQVEEITTDELIDSE